MGQRTRGEAVSWLLWVSLLPRRRARWCDVCVTLSRLSQTHNLCQWQSGRRERRAGSK